MSQDSTPATLVPNYGIDASGIVRTDEGPVPVTPLPAARGRSHDSRTAEARDAVRAARMSETPAATGAGAGTVKTEAAPAPALVRPTLAPDLEHRLTQDDVDTFAHVSSRLGLTTPQAQSLIEFYADRVKANADTNRRPTEAAARVELQAEWGEHFPRKVALANKAVDALGGDKLRARLRTAGLINDPELARVFAGLGERMVADDVARARVRRGASLDRETAALEYRRVMTDPSHDYWNGRAPGHKRAVHEVNTLAAALYGTTPVPTPGVDPVPPPAPSRSREESVRLAILGMEADSIAKAWIRDLPHPTIARAHPERGEATAHYFQLLRAAAHKDAATGPEIADRLFNDARQGRRETR